MDLSVIVPVYNEEESVPHLHANISQALNDQPFAYEVIYVDDGSKDSTFSQLSKIAVNDHHVKVVHLRRNFGQTAAMSAGVANSSGDVLVFMDGDLQNDPIDIPRLLAKLNEGYDIVSGWRKNRQDAKISRKLPSWFANRIISRVTGTHLHDYGCTLKAYRREVFEHVRLYGEMHRFIPAYAALGGASIAEIPVSHHARQFGSSKYGISRTIRVILDLVTLKFLGSFATKPAYAFGMPGMAALSAGGLLSILLLGKKVVQPQDRLHRKPLFVVALGLMGFGGQCLMTGLLAEVLMRTYHESQDKPTYVIKDVVAWPSDTAEEDEVDLDKDMTEQLVAMQKSYRGL